MAIWCLRVLKYCTAITFKRVALLISICIIFYSLHCSHYMLSTEIFEDEIETKDGKKYSKISGSPVDWVEEESFFFKLSAWSEKLLKYYEDNKNFILPLPPLAPLHLPKNENENINSDSSSTVGISAQDWRSEPRPLRASVLICPPLRYRYLPCHLGPPTSCHCLLLVAS